MFKDVLGNDCRSINQAEGSFLAICAIELGLQKCVFCPGGARFFSVVKETTPDTGCSKMCRNDAHREMMRALKQTLHSCLLSGWPIHIV